MINNEHQNLFAELENGHSNGYETRIIEQARELEDLLNDRPAEITELDQLDIDAIEKESIAKMDAECPYYHQKVLVTGSAIKAVFDEFTEEFTLDNETKYTKTILTSAGFSTLEIPDSNGGSKITVGHLFLNEVLDPVSQGEQLVDYLPRLYSFAPVGTVDILADLPDADNIELLSSSMPEMMLEVEQAIFAAENECDALRRLRTIKLSSSHDTPQESLVAMLGFIERRLEMDTMAPYVLSVQGIVQSVDDEDYTYYREPNDILAYHAGLRFASYPYVKDGMLRHKDEGELMVELNVISPNKNDPPQELIVPVRNIRAMHSIRESIKPEVN